MHLLRTLIAAASLALAAPAFAHTDDWFDANPSPNGGQVRMAGPYHFELMPQQGKDGVLVHVTDHGDKKVATKGWKASAVILAGGKKTRVELKPGAGNTLTGKGALGGADAKIVVSITDQGGKQYSARFTPGAAKKAAAPGGHEHHGHDHHHH